ncbi:MAG: amidohydrolase [Acidobacteria bacterium]|nr:MAG: amidohydrolase [Acidobacteriota bacterium]
MRVRSARSILAALTAVLAISAPACLRSRSEEADLILTHGIVHTLAGDDRRASAMAVLQGRLLAVGDEDQVLRHRGPRTPVLDLKGATVVPGFVDAHGPLLGAGETLLNESTGDSLYVDLADTESEEDAVQRVRARARGLPPGGWVLGKGWDEERWTRKDLPDKRLLSDIVQNNPAFLVRRDGHAAWVNHRALEAAGIGSRTPDPPGGRIVRATRSGEPSGILLDRAWEPALRRVPPLGPEDRTAALLLALQRYAALGYTAVQAEGSPGRLGLLDLGAKGDQVADLLRALAGAGRLPIRVSLLVPAPSEAAEALLLRGPEIGLADGRLDVRTVELFADGAFESRGAALLQPYADDPSTSGLGILGAEEIAAWAARGMRRGVQVAVHARGDAALRAAAEGFAKAVSLSPGADPRFRVEGLALFDAADLPALARARVIATVRPASVDAGPEGLLEERRVGAERAGRLYAFGSLLEAGLPLAGTSGSFDRPQPAILGFYCAVTRRGPDGAPPGGWHAGQRLERREALRLFTLGAAYASFHDTDAGTLVPGKWADFTVLSQDILAVPEDRLLATEVLATYVGGQPAYRRERAAGP